MVSAHAHLRHPERRCRIEELQIKQYVGEWLSLVEHLVRDQGVGGSNPLSPTNIFDTSQTLNKPKIDPLVLGQVPDEAWLSGASRIALQII